MPAFRRVHVSIEDRLDGDRTRFRLSLDGDVAHEFLGKPLRVAVEWCDAIRCNEVSIDYSTISSGHGPALLLECMSATQGNTWCSWNGSASRTLCMLQNDLGSGVYGIQQDGGRVRRESMGAITSGQIMDAHGPMELRLSIFTGSTDAYLPFRWTTNSNAVSQTGGAWMAACDYWSSVNHETASLSSGLTLELRGLVRMSTYNTEFLHLGRSYRTGEENWFSQRLSIKGMSTDALGQKCVTDPDSISGVRVRVLDSTTGQAPADPDQLGEFVFSVVVWHSPVHE
eukprot:jgi/Tetstr1/430215/TSEL_020044.t1